MKAFESGMMALLSFYLFSFPSLALADNCGRVIELNSRRAVIVYKSGSESTTMTMGKNRWPFQADYEFRRLIERTTFSDKIEFFELNIRENGGLKTAVLERKTCIQGDHTSGCPEFKPVCELTIDETNM